MHLPKNIKHLRKQLGMSQVELGHKIGTTNSTISGYENGANEPTAGMLMKLATALEVSVDDLLHKDFISEPANREKKEERLEKYAREVEAGRKSPEDAIKELGENDLAMLNKLLMRRVRELEQAIKEENPDRARDLDIQ